MAADENSYPVDDTTDAEYFEEDEPGRLERLRARAREAGNRVARWFDKAERSYLSLVRQTSLIAATLLIFGASLLFIGGLALKIGNPDGIQPAQVSVGVADVVTTPENAPNRPASRPADNTPRWSRVLPAAFRERYHQIFRSSFAPYYRQADKQPDRKAFFETIFPTARLDYVEAFNDARLTGAAESAASRPLLVNLETVIAAAATDPGTIRELKAYQAAKRVQVCETVRRTRTRYESYWNSSATNCAYWYEYPYGCSDVRSVSQPYTERVCRMEFPGQIANPQNVMLRLQDQYFAALDRKLQSADAEADGRRTEMMQRKASGGVAIETGIKAFLAFLGLMFIYLLVALERHQRVISRMIAHGR